MYSGRKEVSKFQILHPVFAVRDWSVIKAKIYNQINHCKKRMTSRLQLLA